MAVNRRADKSVDALEAEIEEMMKAEAEQHLSQETTKEEEPKPEVKEPVTIEVTDPEEKNYKKRYGDLRRHAQKEKEKLEAKIRELESREPSDAPVITEEAIKNWAKTNPQATSIIRAIAKEQAGMLSKDLETQFEQIRLTNEEIAKERVFSDVRKAHSDFDTITAQDAFHEWAEAQPEFVQNKIYDNDNAKDVIWAISLYKKEKGIDKVDTSAADHIVTKTRTSPTTDDKKGRWTESKVEKLSAEEFEKHWDEINKSMKSPEFYDLSGGAR